jgi:hypothetical protein
MTTPIPVPPYTPILGHVVQMDTATPTTTIQQWARTYGEIFQVYMLGE